MPSPTVDAAEPRADNALVDRVWRITRLEQLSQTMAANILSGVRLHPDLNRLSPAQRSNVLLQYKRHTRAERFARKLHTHLSRASRSDLHALIALTVSPVARRALTEELAFSPVSLAKMHAYREGNKSDQAHGQRVDLIKRLDQALGVTDIAVAVAGASLYGTSIALRKLQSGETTNLDLETAIKRFGRQIRPVQHEQIQLTYFYLYRRLSITELRDYVELLEREPVRSTQRRLIQALGSEMVAIQGDVVRGIITQADVKPDKLI